MGPHHVLIVEGHDPTRRALSALFRQHGWRAHAVATRAAALAALEPPPECLILDLLLPDGAGVVVLRRAREEGIPVRVVVVTATSADTPEWGEAARLRPDLMIKKPIDWEVVWRYCESEVRR